VCLAAWGTAVLSGDATAQAAVRSVTGDDEPHELRADEHGGQPASGLLDWLEGLRRGGTRGLRAVLPVPGDPVGLTGPAAFNAAAVEAGECVLTDGWPNGPWWGLVPQITGFGSAWEPGTLVTWTLRPVASRPGPPSVGVADAERELRLTMQRAAEELARLDVARWREDAADRLAEVRSGVLPAGALPASMPPRCAHVLATAARIRAIVALASEDDGAAVSGHEITRRAAALRDLDSVCRRAMVAAVNGILEHAG
jgi:hypothetical protein